MWQEECLKKNATEDKHYVTEKICIELVLHWDFLCIQVRSTLIIISCKLEKKLIYINIDFELKP